MYGICGEQYVTDIQFNSAGDVTATRFRFQHKPEPYQKDFIDGLLTTRRAVDQYANMLTTLDEKKTEVSMELPK